MATAKEWWEGIRQLIANGDMASVRLKTGLPADAPADAAVREAMVELLRAQQRIADHDYAGAAEQYAMALESITDEIAGQTPFGLFIQSQQAFLLGLTAYSARDYVRAEELFSLVEEAQAEAAVIQPALRPPFRLARALRLRASALISLIRGKESEALDTLADSDRAFESLSAETAADDPQRPVWAELSLQARLESLVTRLAIDLKFIDLIGLAVKLEYGQALREEARTTPHGPQVEAQATAYDVIRDIQFLAQTSLVGSAEVSRQTAERVRSGEIGAKLAKLEQLGERELASNLGRVARNLAQLATESARRDQGNFGKFSGAVAFGLWMLSLIGLSLVGVDRTVLIGAAVLGSPLALIAGYSFGATRFESVQRAAMVTVQQLNPLTSQTSGNKDGGSD